MAVSCPSCAATRGLKGERRDDVVIVVRCGRCGTTWERDPSRPRCVLCGSDNVVYAPQPLWEKGRGDQRTPAGKRDAYRCYACGAVDATSSTARPGELPSDAWRPVPREF